MASKRTKDRYLAALPRGENNVIISWRLLADDKPDAGFLIERKKEGTDNWETASDNPVVNSTTWQDHPPEPGPCEYRVKGPDGAVSETVTVDSGAAATTIQQETPLAAPAAAMHHLAAGELLNDGKMGFISLPYTW